MITNTRTRTDGRTRYVHTVRSTHSISLRTRPADADFDLLLGHLLTSGHSPVRSNQSQPVVLIIPAGAAWPYLAFPCLAFFFHIPFFLIFVITHVQAEKLRASLFLSVPPGLCLSGHSLPCKVQGTRGTGITLQHTYLLTYRPTSRTYLPTYLSK